MEIVEIGETLDIHTIRRKSTHLPGPIDVEERRGFRGVARNVLALGGASWTVGLKKG